MRKSFQTKESGELSENLPPLTVSGFSSLIPPPSAPNSYIYFDDKNFTKHLGVPESATLIRRKIRCANFPAAGLRGSLGEKEATKDFSQARLSTCKQVEITFLLHLLLQKTRG